MTDNTFLVQTGQYKTVVSLPKSLSSLSPWKRPRLGAENRIGKNRDKTWQDIAEYTRSGKKVKGVRSKCQAKIEMSGSYQFRNVRFLRNGNRWCPLSPTFDGTAPGVIGCRLRSGPCFGSRSRQPDRPGPRGNRMIPQPLSLVRDPQ
jgi:hypothetical protein